MDERFVVTSPSPEIHNRVLGIAQRSKTLVLENRRRLYLSVRNPSKDLLDQLTSAGAAVEREVQYHLEPAAASSF